MFKSHVYWWSYRVRHGSTIQYIVAHRTPSWEILKASFFKGERCWFWTLFLWSRISPSYGFHKLQRPHVMTVRGIIPKSPWLKLDFFAPFMVVGFRTARWAELQENEGEEAEGPAWCHCVFFWDLMIQMGYWWGMNEWHIKWYFIGIYGDYRELILKTWLNGISINQSIYIYISMGISRGLQLTNYFVFLILEGYVS